MRKTVFGEHHAGQLIVNVPVLAGRDEQGLRRELRHDRLDDLAEGLRIVAVVTARRQRYVDGEPLAGAVAARVETPFAFRVLGRLVARPVQIGATVKQGDTLAAIDPLSLRLAVRSAEAELASATAQLANAQGVAERQGALIKSNATTQAQLEAAEQARSSALAGQTRARAALAKAKEEAAYAVLKADFPGVVTNTGAEVGQTVAPGQMVVNVADPAFRDAVIDAPDTAAASSSSRWICNMPAKE